MEILTIQPVTIP